MFGFGRNMLPQKKRSLQIPVFEEKVTLSKLLAIYCISWKVNEEHEHVVVYLTLFANKLSEQINKYTLSANKLNK